MKHLPNVISALRFLGAICLLFFGVESCAFWVIYFVCGLSDMADGYFARKLGCESKTGAILDSLADLVFVVCCCFLCFIGFFFHEDARFFCSAKIEFFHKYPKNLRKRSLCHIFAAY